MDLTDRRTEVLRLFEAGVAAADPYRAVAGALGADKPALIVAVGKAARRMAEAALAAYPGVRAIVVTNYENAKPLAGAEVLASGHPVPDGNGAAAAEAVIAALKAASGPVLALISGGGSALLPAPAEGITLAEKAEVNRLLLASGADITEMNLIRQQLSRLKGGGFARLAAPNPVRALILSDVIGDDLRAIASGPTTEALGTAADAIARLKARGLWDKVAASVRAHLGAAPAPAPLPPVTNRLVGSNGQSLAAMAAASHSAKAITAPIVGDVADAAKAICDAAGQGVTLWGGETTVQIKGTGLGGRNQELALRIALEAERRGWPEGWVCLQGGTDGRDGPTEAAGGLVDSGTLGRIRAKGGDPEALLANNDSNAALALAGDLLITDATGTNVADLGILIRL